MLFGIKADAPPSGAPLGKSTLGPDQRSAFVGFPDSEIGGVAPVGHDVEKRGVRLKTLIDADLLTYDVIWAAAGSPN